MSVIGGAFGNVPGLDSSYTTYENAFVWGLPNQGRGLILPCPILATAVDAGASPTWRLRPGLVLGRITSTGKLKQYDATATDGSQIAFGVLMQGLAMTDPLSGTTRDKFLGVLVSGPLQAARLYGLDQKARGDLKSQGVIFDDDPHGAVASWRVTEGAFGNTTTVITQATYPNGTHFVITSGAGAAVFTLPAIAPGLRYKFTQTMDQNMTVQRGGSDNLVADGLATAVSVAASTASHKIGASVEAQAIYVGSSTYKWLIMNVSAAPAVVITTA